MKEYVIKLLKNNTILIYEEDEEGIIYQLFIIDGASFEKVYPALLEEMKEKWNMLIIDESSFDLISHDRDLLFY